MFKELLFYFELEVFTNTNKKVINYLYSKKNKKTF